MSDPFWQPTLEGPQCFLRPLLPEDFDALYEAARDPSVWEQHPVPDRYKLDKFKSFFEGALQYCVFEVSKNQWAELSKEGGPLFLFPNHMAERNR